MHSKQCPVKTSSCILSRTLFASRSTFSLFKNQSTHRTSRVLVSLLSEPQTDQVFPDAVRKQQHMWFQTGVRNMQNNESEEMEDDHCVFPARSKCKVHAVRLRVQSKPRSLQDDMTRLRKVCVHRESKKDTATSPKIDSSAHQQFSRLCHAAHAQKLLTAHLPVSKGTSMSWRFFRHCRCCCPSNRLCSSHPASSLFSGSGSIFRTRRFSGKCHSSTYTPSRCPPTLVWWVTTSPSPRYSPTNLSPPWGSIMVCRSFGTDPVFCSGSQSDWASVTLIPGILNRDRRSVLP